MASGKSLELRQITLPEPTWVHQHTTPTIAMRRAWPFAKENNSPRCQPYANPARDLKRHRRLRADLRKAAPEAAS